jgi:hypothetical protein
MGCENEMHAPGKGRRTKEVSVATLDERHTGPNGAGPNRTRWIAIVLVAAAIAAGVVLLVLYGGGGSSGPY